jgi:hypothetical protein
MKTRALRLCGEDEGKKKKARGKNQRLNTESALRFTEVTKKRRGEAG